jgi:hypothetical protein
VVRKAVQVITRELKAVVASVAEEIVAAVDIDLAHH